MNVGGEAKRERKSRVYMQKCKLFITAFVNALKNKTQIYLKYFLIIPFLDSLLNICSFIKLWLEKR